MFEVLITQRSVLKELAVEFLRYSLANRKPFTLATNLQRVQWISIGLLFALFYGPVIPGLVKDWQEHSTFSYGFLVPLIAIYLVWQRREKLKCLPITPSVWAIIPLLVALAVGLIGQAMGDSFSVRNSMILCLASVVWLILGKDFLKVLLFPLFYLALMIPVPYALIKDFTYYLRYSDATHAEQGLRLLGVPVYREAYFLHLPNMTLEVADVCSGVSSVFALFALGVVYAHALPVRTSLKCLLVACTFPFALVANLFRIILTGVLVYNFGPVVLQSSFHGFSGTVTFLLALSMLILLGENLRNERLPELVDKKGLRQFDDIGPAAPVAWSRSLLGVAIFLGALYVSGVLREGYNVTLRSDLSTVLRSSEPFNVAPIAWADRYNDPNAELVLSRLYAGADKAPIEVFVGYRGSQNGGLRLSSPKLILPDKWNFAWIEPARVDVGNAMSIHANWMLTRRGNATRLVLYWYQLGDQTVAGEFDYRFKQVTRSIFERRSDGLVVRLATSIGENEPVKEAQERLKMFCKLLYPELLKLLPA